MSDFNKSIKVILEQEGGFVDNPADRGGPTNFGITIPTACDYLGEDVSSEYIRQLSPQTAAAIYKRNYWDKLGLDSIADERLATVVMSLAVLRGVPDTVHALQTLCGVTPDRHFGPETALAFQQNAAHAPQTLAESLLHLAQAQCEHFADLHPEQSQFLPGWVNRFNQLRGLFA